MKTFILFSFISLLFFQPEARSQRYYRHPYICRPVPAPPLVVYHAPPPVVYYAPPYRVAPPPPYYAPRHAYPSHRRGRYYGRRW